MWSHLPSLHVHCETNHVIGLNTSVEHRPCISKSQVFHFLELLLVQHLLLLFFFSSLQDVQRVGQCTGDAVECEYTFGRR